jgi:hypothetical protein
MTPEQALEKLKALLTDPEVRMSPAQFRDLELIIVIFNDMIFKLRNVK